MLIGGLAGRARRAARRRVEDSRIKGVVLVSMPAWPWQGIRKGGEAIAELLIWELGRSLHPRLAQFIARRVRAVGRALAPGGDDGQRRPWL